MWRHAVNAYMLVGGAAQDYMIMGPLRGGGELVELGWIGETGASCTVRFAAAVSGSPSATLANLRASTSLIQRSNDVSATFGVPTITAALTSAQYYRVVLPMSVRLDAGAQYIVLGIQCATGDVAFHTIGWALEIGHRARGVARVGMVNGNGLGVEDGLDR